MADLDDLREGADFGLGINCENQSFHVWFIITVSRILIF